MRRARVVIDTNVVISSFFGGYPKDVLDLVENGGIQLVISTEIALEIHRVITRVLKNDQLADRFIDFLLQKSDHIVTTTQINIINDQSDNKFVECAIDGKADFIISGDKHLLTIQEYEGIAIIPPRQLVEVIKINPFSIY